MQHLSLKKNFLRLFFYSTFLTAGILMQAVVILNSSFVMAQGWERTYEWGYFGGISSGVLNTSDGGYIVTGIGQGNGIFLYKINAKGDSVWAKFYGGSLDQMGKQFQKTYEGGYIIVGDIPDGNGNWDVFAIKTDSEGILKWSKTYGDIYGNHGNSIQQTNDSGYIMISSDQCYMYMTKTDSIGNAIWVKSFTDTCYIIGESIKQTNDGGYIVVGSKLIYPYESNLFILKTNSLGETLWEKTYGGQGTNCGYDVEITSDGGYIFVGVTNSWSPGEIYLLKANSAGDTTWTKRYGGAGLAEGFSVKPTFDGGFIVVGNTAESWPVNNFDFFLLKIDSLGEIGWYRTFGFPFNDRVFDIAITPDGGYLLAGYTINGSFNHDLYFVKTDSAGNVHTNIIGGCAFIDTNVDCSNDSLEPKINNQLIKIIPEDKYLTTNIEGVYSISLDTGTFTVESFPPSPYWKQTCPTPPTYTVNFTSFYDTSSANDFGYEIAIYCPLMSVDISTWALRPCSTSVYTVQYCNNGTTPADSASIEVTFDNEITPVSSTLPWSAQNGNTYNFNIGNIAPLQCSNFYITADVSCNAVLGSTHCIEAHIYPDSICNPIDTSWDHSSVSVEGICNNDSLACFTIYNSGDAMQGTSQYRIYENNVLVDTGSFQLAAGDSIIICHPANGFTIRLEADQRPGHPGNSQPQAHVELCGGIPPAAMGFIMQVPEDDADEFIEMDCRQITASFDPNEKLVKPAGITSNHFIDSTDILEYQINFQNTGTDTAFKIVVRDTLTQNLDITTVQSGAGSHPYSFRIYGQGILEWTFNNILLPDSNTNEALSHGFVRFKAKQKTGITLGTVIENRAAIYFDYNAPVITNTTFNTLWKEPTLSVSPIYQTNKNVLVYPNPTNGKVAVAGAGGSISSIEIYNLLGEKVFPFSPFPSGRVGDGLLDISNQPNGIYFIKVKTSDAVYFQKLVKQ